MRVLELDTHAPPETVVGVIREALNSGELVVLPTETRYGILARADKPSSVDNLYRAKGRSGSSPTALFVKDLESMGKWGEITPAAQSLGKRFLPGPLTLVLRARVSWPPPLVVGGKIGCRYSSSVLIARLIEHIDYPITATSANRSGSPDKETIEEIRAELGDTVAIYVDGGKLSGPVSTVVDCSADPVIILREGAIPADEVRQALTSEGVQ
ncbi:MAG: L-threonylcarbamoyladenylate synthase [Candidatus Zixiibacteriota bacterium]